MNRKNSFNPRCSCEAFEPLLTGFADGELDVAATAAVGEHLKICRTCRVQVATLRRSLAIARSIWHESAESATERTSTRSRVDRRQAPTDTRRLSLRGPLAAAAMLMITIVTCWVWYASRPHDIADRSAPPRDDRQERRAEIGSGPDQQEAIGLPLDDEAIDAVIRREEQAARLAMAIEIMASVPELESDVARARKYLESTYGSETTNTQPNHQPFAEGS